MRAALVAGTVAALLVTGPLAAGLIWMLPARSRGVGVVWGTMAAVFVFAACVAWLSRRRRKEGVPRR